MLKQTPEEYTQEFGGKVVMQEANALTMVKDLLHRAHTKSSHPRMQELGADISSQIRYVKMMATKRYNIPLDVVERIHEAIMLSL